ncbi:TetR/AcrR family transcriptional regulator [Cupriavidus basilensis]|nr:TetR/AcrR family transcriptional regulator [Cupriavidus basilensis]
MSTADKARRRVSGRPTGEDTVGKQAIIQSTVELLKIRAPEQLTVLEVAAKAGVARTLVRYYFGDLHGLLREVTECLMGQLQDRMEVVMRMQGSVRERVHQRLLLRLEFMREHPYFERLALGEIYYGEDATEENPAGSALQRITKRGLELTDMILEDAQGAKVDARFLHLVILSVSAFIPSAQPLLHHLFGTGEECEQQVDAYLQFVSRMLADAIDQQPERTKP